MDRKYRDMATEEAMKNAYSMSLADELMDPMTGGDNVLSDKDMQDSRDAYSSVDPSRKFLEDYLAKTPFGSTGVDAYDLIRRAM